MNKKIIISMLLTTLTAYISSDYDILTSIFVFILYYGVCLSVEWMGKFVPKKKEEEHNESK